ncbi:MAG: hypothetical protein PUE84_02950 [Firmicutes bacterium]|nr:hypothetical protein [Bacillota bacterium]
MKKILVVEDDRHLNTGIVMALQGGRRCGLCCGARYEMDLRSTV